MSRRILIATTSPLTMSAFVAPLLEELNLADFEISLMFGSGQFDLELFTGAKNVVQINLGRGISLLSDLKSIPECYRQIRHLKPEIVLSSTPKITPILMVCAWICRVPVRVFQVRGARWEGLSSWKRFIVQLADRIASLFSTNIISVSESLTNLFREYNITGKQIDVLGRGSSKGVDLELFTSTRRYDQSSPSVIGFLGRLSSDKGIDNIREVFESIKLKHPETTLEVVGAIDATQPIDSSTIGWLNSSEGVIWHQQVQHSLLPKIIEKWTLLLFPSSREGLPNAVIEAAAMGVPTVGWDVTGVRDAVVNNVTGYLVSYGNTSEMVSKIESILLADDKLIMRLNAEAFAHKNFDSRVVGRNFVNYLALLGGKK